MNVLIIGFDTTVFLDESQTTGDARRRHIAYADELAREEPGSRVFMITRTGRGSGLSPLQLSSNLWALPTNSRPGMFLLDAYRLGTRLCGNPGVGLVTTQSPFSDGVVGYLLRHRCRCKLLVQLHISDPDDPAWLLEHPLNRLRSTVARLVCQRADAVRTVSQTARARLHERWRIPTERLFAVPVAPSLEAEEVPTEPGRTILFVGRLSPEKDVPILLKAVQILHQEYSDVQAVVVGDGPERESLEQMAADLALAKCVSFAGPVPYKQLPAFYRSARVAALPSRHESYGRVILEAFAYARPVVATDTEGARELVRDGENGYIVPRGDPSALAERLGHLLEHGDVAGTMGRAGWKRFVETYAPAVVRRSVVEMWLKVGAQPAICA